MRVMMQSDYIQSRRMMASTLIISFLVGLIITMSTEQAAAGAAAVAAIVPYMVTVTIIGNDDAAGWAKMRETMPLTRREVVIGRYLGVLVVSLGSAVYGFVVALIAAKIGTAILVGAVGQAVLGPVGATLAASLWGMALSLLMLSIVLPFMMRMGLTRAARILPLLFVMVFCAAASLMPDSVAAMPGSFSLMLVTVVLVVVALIAFAVSAFVSCRLYEAREF